MNKDAQDLVGFAGILILTGFFFSLFIKSIPGLIISTTALLVLVVEVAIMKGQEEGEKK